MKLLTLVAVSVFSAIPMIASAHGGNTDTNAVHACVGNVSKVVRIVGVNGSCISAPAVQAETPTHWAIQGPQGASGTNGTNGTNGSSVTITGSILPGDAHCSNGGLILTDVTGTPYYLCNGVNGAAEGAHADPPCFDNTNRYVNCGNGSVTDTFTGLIWLQRSDCFPAASYAEANVAVTDLQDGDCGLMDGSGPGDWRLPTQAEWSLTLRRALNLRCQDTNTPSLTNDAATACLVVGPSSFTGVATDVYWSSTTEQPDGSTASTDASKASAVSLLTGDHVIAGKASTHLVWPVRGGSR